MDKPMTPEQLKEALIFPPKIKEIPKKNKVPLDYKVIFKLTDKQMRPRDLEFTNSKERLSFEQEVEVSQADSETDAEVGATFIICQTWNKNKYNIERISIKENLIQMPHNIFGNIGSYSKIKSMNK